MAVDLYCYDVVSATDTILAAVEHLLSMKANKDQAIPISLQRELEEWRANERGVECNMEVGLEPSSKAKKMMKFGTVCRIQQQLLLTPMPDDNFMRLHDLLHNSEVVFPTYKPPSRNPELVQRLEKIRKMTEKKEYQNMVENIAPERKGVIAREIRMDVQATHRQLWIVANFLLTVIGSFVFGYYAAFFGGMSQIGCVVTGLSMATLVFFADLYFVAKTA